MPYLKRGSSSIFYIDEGKGNGGQPILFIHGWTCDIQDWVFQLAHFQELGHRTIAFDARGHGRSSVPSEENPSELGPETTVDDAEALLQHLDITRCNPAIVFGHSSGCLIASLLAIRCPSLVRALVLVSPMYYRPSDQGLKAGRKLDGDAHGFVDRIFEAQGTTAETPGWLTVWHRVRLLGVPEWVVREAAYQREPAGSWEVVETLLPRRTAPRFVLVPDATNLAKERGLGMGQNDQFFVMNAGHWMHVQKSECFNGLVRDWLATLG